jgi:hypothetical protein
MRFCLIRVNSFHAAPDNVGICAMTMHFTPLFMSTLFEYVPYHADTRDETCCRRGCVQFESGETTQFQERGVGVEQ